MRSYTFLPVALQSRQPDAKIQNTSLTGFSHYTQRILSPVRRGSPHSTVHYQAVFTDVSAGKASYVSLGTNITSSSSPHLYEDARRTFISPHLTSYWAAGMLLLPQVHSIGIPSSAAHIRCAFHRCSNAGFKYAPRLFISLDDDPSRAVVSECGPAPVP